MTTAELHEILDDQNRKLTADELKEVVYQLKQDCWDEYYKENAKENANNFKMAHYYGEINAFFICLDLLEHLKEADDWQIGTHCEVWEDYEKDGIIHYRCPICETIYAYVKEEHISPCECKNCGSRMKGGAE